jgi:hypothetical protein
MKKVTLFDPTIDPDDLTNYDPFEVEIAFPVD